MKVQLDFDVDKDDFAMITKWLKHYHPNGNIADALKRLCNESLLRWRSRAQRYNETDKTAMEQFMEEISNGKSDIESRG